jgi:predicted GNAT superfamily acetyltransferase
MTQAPPASAVTVRDVRGIAELRACQDLQRRAWGITEDGYVLPVATMASVQRVGGLILGAFDARQMLIGFAFAFLGRLNDRLILWSQLTGVHPAQQSSGVGRLLKFEQRRRAHEMGLETVAWAFDPVQASNAAFNLGVLGARCQTYELNMYGSRTDALNAGLATDRLIAEWATSGTASGGRTAAWMDAETLIDVRDGQPVEVRPVPPHATHLELPIPARIAELKARGALDAVREWQAAIRLGFQSAFGAGFVAVGFSRADPVCPRYLFELDQEHPR